MNLSGSCSPDLTKQSKTSANLSDTIPSENCIIYVLISLHIRSMWETICDVWACWSGWNFGPNSTEYPYSEIQFQNTPPRKWKLSEILALWLFSFRIPPPNENCQRSWHFDFFSFRIPPPQNENCQRSCTLTFQFQFQNTPPNENCQRSWHFDFSVSEYPPSRKWKLSEILALWLFSFSFRIPPPPKMKIVRDLGTLRLFSFRTMCGKLTHVETLSSPDNYFVIMSF